MFLTRSPISNIRQRFQRRNRGRRTQQPSFPRPQATPHSTASRTETYGYVTAIDGQRYKITLPLGGLQGSLDNLRVKVEQVPTFDEMIRSYRSKPQCLTLNEIELLFPLLSFEEILPIIYGENGRRTGGRFSSSSCSSSCSSSMDLAPEDMDHSCMICLTQLQAKDEVRLLSCNHLFHDTCIVPWVLYNNGNCPLCKKTFRDQL